MVQFILKRDVEHRFRFVPLQSAVGRSLLVKYQLDPDEQESVVVIHAGKAYLKSSAALRIAMELPDPWPLAGILIFIPAELRDQAYDFIARHRKQWVKAPDSCRVAEQMQDEQQIQP